MAMINSSILQLAISAPATPAHLLSQPSSEVSGCDVFASETSRAVVKALVVTIPQQTLLSPPHRTARPHSRDERLLHSGSIVLLCLDDAERCDSLVVFQSTQSACSYLSPHDYSWCLFSPRVYEFSSDEVVVWIFSCYASRDGLFYECFPCMIFSPQRRHHFKRYNWNR